MAKLDYDLLKRLSETPGIASREHRIRAAAVEALRPLVDDVRVDRLGNAVGLKRGSGRRRVMLAAHLDEIGFLVRHVDKDGFLRLQPVGGFDARALFAQRVLVHASGGATLRGVLMPAGGKPPHLMAGEEPKPPKVEDYFVDVGLPGVATVQEEVGLRGATTAAFGLEPDVGVALDVTLAVDIPGTEDPNVVSRLGKGVGIKIMDSASLSDPRLVSHFRDIARREHIPFQMEILPRGGTDAGGIQRSRAGVPAITLSIPARYVHTVNEMVSETDVQAAVDLLARYLEEAHSFDYAHPSD
jgi:endoglucanase